MNYSKILQNANEFLENIIKYKMHFQDKVLLNDSTSNIGIENLVATDANRSRNGFVAKAFVFIFAMPHRFVSDILTARSNAGYFFSFFFC